MRHDGLLGRPQHARGDVLCKVLYFISTIYVPAKATGDQNLRE